MIQEIRTQGPNPEIIRSTEQLTGQEFPVKPDQITQNSYLRQCGQSVDIPQKLSTDTQTYLGLKMTPAGPTPKAEDLFHTNNQRFGIQSKWLVVNYNLKKSLWGRICA